ncbi:MAG: fructose-6-phosphate aldolase [Armatimonadetes bacterium]|nr:fructose-6-phosphate aldolase [Armatimonadota bacterium]NIO76634.1 fructose-6-phosphate aldolase [Armatimonadota bacterium]NIO96443.1 fructose-6-phosphate aldolase [Armatimonadota bacterium]
MKIFVDTANVDDIREAASWGIVDGVTTNPSLVAKEKRNFREVVLEICDIVDGPISAEIVSVKADEMVEDAKKVASWHPNIVIKVPFIPEGVKAIPRLAAEGIKTNVTLCFSANQALLAAKAGGTFCSIFLGRLDDAGHDGMEVVREAVQIYRNYGYATKVLAASIRHPLHVVEAAKAGADIATIPFKVLQQMFQHPLTEIGLKRFLDDWAKVPKSTG